MRAMIALNMFIAVCLCCAFLRKSRDAYGAGSGLMARDMSRVLVRVRVRVVVVVRVIVAVRVRHSFRPSAVH